MKKLVPAIAVLAVAIGIVAYVAISLSVKRKYDKTRTELADHVLSEVPMDAETKALLAEVRTSWVEMSSEVGGPHSDALKKIGLKPSVSSVSELLTYRMPEYSMLLFGRNRRPMLIGTIQAVLLPISIDKSIHVSDDRHVALIRLAPTIVYVFEDDAVGLRESQYCPKKESTEPAAEDDAANLAHSSIVAAGNLSPLPREADEFHTATHRLFPHNDRKSEDPIVFRDSDLTTISDAAAVTVQTPLLGGREAAIAPVPENGRREVVWTRRQMKVSWSAVNRYAKSRLTSGTIWTGVRCENGLRH